MKTMNEQRESWADAPTGVYTMALEANPDLIACYEEIRAALVRLRKHSPPMVVAYKVFSNFEEMEITCIIKDPTALKRNGISMRNYNGDWIQDPVLGLVPPTTS